MSGQIHAPFTAGQVLRLRQWQACDWVHPYTCGSDAHDEVAKLNVEVRGLTCGCGTLQTWAWDAVVPAGPFASFDA